MKTVTDNSAKYIWNEVVSLEKKRAEAVHKITERYSGNIEKNQEAINLINSNDPGTIVNGLLSLALYADDGVFVQDLMVRYSQHRNENIRGIAILCFGHIARLHGTVNKELIIPLIHNALKDESTFVRGHAYSALDDIELFYKQSQV
ncbi:hypothetical protein [Paenibacillus chitinolyticus]